MAKENRRKMVATTSVVKTSLLEGNLYLTGTRSPWSTRGRGAVRWGPNDYVLWNRGEVVIPPGYLTPGGCSYEHAEFFVRTGKIIPFGRTEKDAVDPPKKQRRRHSREGNIRCEICAPLRCSHANGRR